MAKKFVLYTYARFVSMLRNHRVFLSGMHKVAHFIRKLKIPLYKNVYDWLSFYSYFVVLKRVLMAKTGGTYFEWGPGMNTALANKYMKSVYSVEHEEAWYKKYSQKFKLIFSPIANNSSLSYPEEIRKIAKPVDVAFVDGRCRVECIKVCAELRVPVVVMHDSLAPSTFEYACDGQPPEYLKDVYCYTAYPAYNYFIEVVDLRTIILVSQESDLSLFRKLFSDFYIKSGKTGDYLKTV